MYVKGATENDLYRAAGMVEGIRIRDTGNHPHDQISHVGNKLRFRLATVGPKPKYGRVSHRYTRTGKPARIPGAVCWHGHRDFMMALFSLCPDAILYTSVATYKGKQNFLDTFENTEYRASLPCNCNPDVLRDAARGVVYGAAIV